VFIDHNPGENLHQAGANEAADKKSSIHNLVSGLVGLKKLDARINRAGNEDNSPDPNHNYDG
jgi:hypothetical protein